MKLSYTSENRSPEKILIFSQEKDFLIFWKKETSKKFFTLQESELSYISENAKKLYEKVRKMSYI